MTTGGAVGGVLGAVGGFFIGGPYGAMIGFSLGMGIGSFIDPPKMDEPGDLQRQDLQYNTFARNMPVPVVYGVNKVSGNLVWLGNTRSEVVERSSGGGKGSPDPPKTREVWYWADFAVALSEGEIGGTSKVWLDDEDISDLEGINYTAYDGTTTQTADSHVTTALASTAPSWRNLAYLLVSGRLGQMNRLPTVSSKIAGILSTAGDAYTWAEVGTNALPNTITAHAVVEKGGVFYSIAGSIGGVASQKVYKSTDQGATWTEIGTNVFPIAQTNLAACVYNSKIYASCGAAGTGRQVYMSADNGLTWAEQGTNAFPHALFDHTMLVFDNKMWIVGGILWAGTRDPRVYYSTNGSAWIEAGAALPSGGIGKHGSAVLDGKMWVLGGSTQSAGTSQSVYYSADGVTWTQAGTNSLPAAMDSLGAFAHNNKLWIVGGSDSTFAGLRTYSSPDGITWTRRGDLPTGLDTARACLVSAFRAYVIGGVRWTGGTSQKVMRTNVGEVVLGSNPARCIRDFLLNTRYGLGLATTTMDDPSFGAAADYCDELVTNADGTVETRAQLDYIIDAQRSVLDHLRDMLATFRGFLIWSGGTVKLRVEQDETVAQSFDMNSIVADSFQWRKQGYRDRANVVRIEYINSADDFRHDFVEAFDDWDLDTTGERRERVLRLVGIKRSTQAARMAMFYLDQSIHVAHACSFKVGIAALKCEVGDVIQVSHDVPQWVSKKFRILGITEEENDELQLNCLEHVSDIYHDNANASQVPDGETINPYEIPYHVIRLSAQKRPNESIIELAFTRAVSSDLFAGALLYRKRGAGDYEQVETSLAVAPSAYLDSQVQSVARTTSGTSTMALQETFTRADAASLGNDWQELVPSSGAWEVWSNTARRGTPGSGGPTGDVVAITSGHAWSGDGFVEATTYDSSGYVTHPRVGLIGRHQSLSGAGSFGGQAYVFGYMTKTLSNAILDVALYRVTSGPVWTSLSKAAVNSGAYWSTPTSPTVMRLDISSYTLQGKLNGTVLVSAVDSWIRGAGEAGFARQGAEEAYEEQVMADLPRAYWKLNETTASAKEEMASIPGSFFGTVSHGLVGAIAGDSGTAAFFPGSGQKMVTTATSLLTVGSADFSMEMWVAFTTGLRGDIFNIQNYTTSTASTAAIQGAFACNVNSGDGKIWHYTWEATSLGLLLQSTSLMNTGSYHHAVAVYHVGSNYTELFIDGTQQDSRWQGSKYTVDVRSPFHAILGSWVASSNPFAGKLDEVAFYPFALSSARILERYRAGIGSRNQQTGQGERWDTFTWGSDVNSPVLVRGLVHGWSARIFDPSSVLLGGAVASNGLASFTITTSVPLQPASGFIQVFADATYSIPAPSGRLPSSGFVGIRGGDVYDYKLLQDYMTATQTHGPILNALGGWANVGSARLRTEQIGYATFTDSQLTGATRGAGGTTATSHSNVVSLGAWIVESGGVGSASLVDLTIPATDPLSNVSFFTAQSMRVFVGASSRFSRLSVYLQQNASPALTWTARYSTGDAAWASATTSALVGPVDQTSKFSRSGHILIEPPGDWAPTNRVVSGTALGDSTSRYFLELTRTAAALSTAPVELQILLDGNLIVAGRKANAFEYAPVLADSGQALTFKALTVGVRGQTPDGAKAPTTLVWSG